MGFFYLRFIGRLSAVITRPPKKLRFAHSVQRCSLPSVCSVYCSGSRTPAPPRLVGAETVCAQSALHRHCSSRGSLGVLRPLVLVRLYCSRALRVSQNNPSTSSGSCTLLTLRRLQPRFRVVHNCARDSLAPRLIAQAEPVPSWARCPLLVIHCSRGLP